jgi:pyruvate dehydrogenase E1 component beta subunit
MTREITFREAISEALAEEFDRHPEMILMGEDILAQGGVFGVYRPLLETHRDRLLETPIAEPGFMGMAVGAAMTGGPVVVEVMFQDFITVCMDEIVNQAAKMRYMTGGQARMPLVIRAASGMGRGTAAQHTQSLEAWFVHVPGLKVVVPSTPADAKGLLKAALRGEDPVLFFEHKQLYALKGEVPEGEHVIPLGRARVLRDGADLTIIAWAAMAHRALEAADILAAEGISAEVLDPRTLSPLDEESVLASVRRTGRALVVDEATMRCSVGSEIAATIGEHAFESLKGPVRRLASPHAPKPFAPVLEALSIPRTGDIVTIAREMLARG